MHVATDVTAELFTVTSHGHSAPWQEVLADWDEHSRFGIVVREPFGALGASLLIQLAALSFYEARPERRSERAQYPQSYLFHLGGPHGDFSNFDFWPPRHELQLPDDPYRLLGELNDRAITHLAIPAGQVRADDDYVLAAPSGWTDRAAAADRLRGVLVYHPSGIVPAGELQVSADDAELERMSQGCLDPQQNADYFQALSDRELLGLEIGPSSVADLRGWAEFHRARADEVPLARRRALVREREANHSVAGRRVESYRRIPPAEALRYL